VGQICQENKNKNRLKMKYINAREKIKSGDLLAFSHGDWKSWNGIKTNMIRIFTRSTYSHVALAWVIGGRVFALEAVRPKLRIYPLSKLGDFYHINLNAKWSQYTEEYALSKIGVDYSQLTAIRAFFTPLENENVQECAAYAIEVMEKDGIFLGYMARPDSVVQAALNNGGNLTFVEGLENEI
jgi:hypothetical protein